MAQDATDQKKQARYIEVASDLRKRIEEAEFAVGDALPTETDLCANYSVSRYTIREALRRLQEAGIVTRRQGSGTMVTSREKATIFQQELGTLEDIIQYSSDVRFELSNAAPKTLDPSLLGYIDATETGGWVHRRAFGFQRHLRRAVGMADIFFPARYDALARRVKGNRGAIFSEFEALSGKPIEQVEQEIRAVNLSDETCEALDCKPGQPGLRAVRAYFDEGGPAMISISLHPGDRYAYHLKFDRKT